MKNHAWYPKFVLPWFVVGFCLMVGLLLVGCNEPSVATKAANDTAANDTAANDTVAIAAENPTQLDKTFDDLKFDIEPDGTYDPAMLTDALLDLDSERVRIRGYILPSAQSRLEQFVLVRDNQECCFGPGAALYDCVLVTMAPGKRADFSIRPVAVEGKFVIKEFRGPEGRLLAIFQMVGEVVE